MFDHFDVVARFAREKIQPLVREMDDASQMDKAVINALFEQGVSWILNINRCSIMYRHNDNEL